MLSYRELDYKNYGKCLEISNGIVDILVTLDIGPRVIRYGFCGRENIMFEDLNREHSYNKEDMQTLYGKDKTWYLYGGHRLWISPEYAETYYPDNSPIKYEKTENGAIFINETQEITGFQLSISIEFTGDTGLKLTHYVANNSGETQDFALWALTVLDKGGVEIIKWNDNDTELLPNRVLVIWPYCDFTDSRVFLGKKYFTLKQDPEKDKIKFGFDLNNGTAAYINKGVIFVKKYTHYSDSEYPDNGCSFETFSNNNFLECETLSEFGPKPDGSVVKHVESWKLIDNGFVENPRDEKELDKLWDRIE